MPAKNKTAPVKKATTAKKGAPAKGKVQPKSKPATTKKGAPKQKDAAVAVQEAPTTVAPKKETKKPAAKKAPKPPTRVEPVVKAEPIKIEAVEIDASGETSVTDELGKAVATKVQDSSYLDHMAAIEKRRANALKRGQAYLMGCVHCGSPDVNANRSIYVAEFEGSTINVKEYRCADCHKYTRTIAETGEALSPTDKLTVLYDAPTRKNYHRAKAHSIDKAFEFVGTDKPTEGGDYAGLRKLIDLASAGDAEAIRVLKEGVAVKMEFATAAENK